MATCLFAADTVVERLTQERMRVLVPDQVEKIPRPIGEHDAMNLGVVLDGPKEVVEGIAGLAAGQSGEGPLGEFQVFVAYRIAQRRAAGWRVGRSHRGRTGRSFSALRPPTSRIRWLFRYRTFRTGSGV